MARKNGIRNTNWVDNIRGFVDNEIRSQPKSAQEYYSPARSTPASSYSRKDRNNGTRNTNWVDSFRGVGDNVSYVRAESSQLSSSGRNGTPPSAPGAKDKQNGLHNANWVDNIGRFGSNRKTVLSQSSQVDSSDHSSSSSTSPFVPDALDQKDELHTVQSKSSYPTSAARTDTSSQPKSSSSISIDPVTQLSHAPNPLIGTELHASHSETCGTDPTTTKNHLLPAR